jgi:squalene-hopene/tetraprenyl-beta-curcumene cyclase
VLKGRGRKDLEPMMKAAARWLLAARNTDGGWGGDRGVASSLEETALAVGALAEYGAVIGDRDSIRSAIAAGCDWIAAATAGGQRFAASPIGLYFARLWYSEGLYPVLFAVEGLGRALAVERSAATVTLVV